MRAEVTGETGPGPAGMHGGAGEDRRRARAVAVLAGLVALAVLVLLGVLGYQVRGRLGAVGGVVVALIVLGVARMLFTLSGAAELARRRARR
jgi:hypothetical protein